MLPVFCRCINPNLRKIVSFRIFCVQYNLTFYAAMSRSCWFRYLQATSMAKRQSLIA